MAGDGTLLGLIRDGGPIKGDLDIDIGVFYSSEVQKKIRSLLIDHGFALYLEATHLDEYRLFEKFYFNIIALIESLILEKGMDDAIERAKAYISAVADGIMIHSRQESPDQILRFCNIYNTFENRQPLIVVPSSYNQVFEEQLISYGVNIVIYANHLLRSAYPAMQETAESNLKNGRSFECNNNCMPIKNILNLIPGTV